jgi:hypothetical protein
MSKTRSDDWKYEMGRWHQGQDNVDLKTVANSKTSRRTIIMLSIPIPGFGMTLPSGPNTASPWRFLRGHITLGKINVVLGQGLWWKEQCTWYPSQKIFSIQMAYISVGVDSWLCRGWYRTSSWCSTAHGDKLATFGQYDAEDQITNVEWGKDFDVGH